MSVLFLVISIVLGALIVFYISNPIKKMMIGIEEVSNGNYDYMIEINTTDEFNMLGKSINNLSRKMKVLIEEKCNKERELLLKDSQIEMQKDVIASQSEQISMLNEKLEELFSENKNICIAAINALTNSLEVKDVYTRGHCERVREYVVKIGQALNLSKNEINELEFAALLHDIGKIGIPSRILNKEDELTEEEAELIKMHPRLGYEIVKNLPFLDNAKYAILQHHERIDGKGYPDGLVDEEISLYSKILAVADAFDAMTTGRKYRIIPYPKEVALEQLIHNKNIQFDARIVDVFVDIIKKEMNEDKNKIPS
ncbi:MAG TPA: HD domain-containing protein [Defluviitaleaceae bacterium]|nr:HD domain-containing protein [Defluviitaleaceae bacterium]